MTPAIVLDTSVWINLLATQRLADVVLAVQRECLIPPQVLKEIRRDPVTGSSYDEANHPMLKIDASVVEMTPAEIQLFLDLVSGTTSARLGEGESACIAVAAERRAVLAIDERKGRRIAAERFPDLTLTSSAALLSSASVVEILGPDAKACFDRALQLGGMHIV